MPKTAEELKALKSKLGALEKELGELSEEELEQVTGGYGFKYGRTPSPILHNEKIQKERTAIAQAQGAAKAGSNGD